MRKSFIIGAIAAVLLGYGAASYLLPNRPQRESETSLMKCVITYGISPFDDMVLTSCKVKMKDHDTEMVITPSKGPTITYRGMMRNDSDANSEEIFIVESYEINGSSRDVFFGFCVVGDSCRLTDVNGVSQLIDFGG